jgi:hypothetical protein
LCATFDSSLPFAFNHFAINPPNAKKNSNKNMIKATKLTLQVYAKLQLEVSPNVPTIRFF